MKSTMSATPEVPISIGLGDSNRVPKVGPQLLTRLVPGLLMTHGRSTSYADHSGFPSCCVRFASSSVYAFNRLHDIHVHD
jgi:hypothetical protein